MMRKVKVKASKVEPNPYYGSKAGKGAFTNPFPGVRAESRIHAGGEKVTEDDPRAKKRRRK